MPRPAYHASMASVSPALTDPHFTILPSSHTRWNERFPQAAAMEAELRAAVRGEVRFDDGTRALYATDASNYRQIPIGVVIPRDEDDVIAAVAVCRKFAAPVLSRGGGTSLAGQCCNVAVILDFSKYMNGIGEVNTHTRTVVVQPGAVLDRVLEKTTAKGLMFAPDPATHSRCTIGGMVGNNSCGVHALFGGKTVDNIIALDVLLYDGTRMTVSATTDEELAAKIAQGGREGGIYLALRNLRDAYANLVRERYPKIPRRVSGYNLDELLPEAGFNVARALVGSEGTCVLVLNATLRLIENPSCRALVGVGFRDIFIAADQVPQLLKHKPIGLEGFSSTLTDALRRKGKLLGDLDLLPEGEGFLIVEFGGKTNEEAAAQANDLLEDLQTWQPAPSARVYNTGDAKRVWQIRESGLGATSFVPGKGTGWEGWEDAAVDPTQLGSYLRQLQGLMDEYGYSSAFYGHFGQGCVHMRLNFDLQSAEGILKFRTFVDRAADIALAHGGSLSGEHGDGQARAALLPKMFGPELVEAFNQFKIVWDPDDRMNPGKLVAPHEIHEDLRLGTDYKPWEPKLNFALPEDNGSYAFATLRCVGVGACRKTDSGTMCPSYMATRAEQHSTRGRAHLLWELMQGEVLKDGWQNQHVHDALDLCLSCKACKSECPVSVDMATYKSEFLSHHFEHKSRPLQHYAFGRIDVWARMASLAPGLVNAVNSSALAAPLKRMLHVAPQRTMPRFAKAFTRTHKHPVVPSQAPRVMLWADTFNNYFHPHVMTSAYSVLEHAGFSVELPKQHLCCGRPLYDFGMLDTAKEYLARVLRALSPQIAAGTPIVVLEPSCASVFRDELCELFPNDERAKKLRGQVLLLSEFLARHAPDFTPPQVQGDIVVHGHCHHKSLMGMSDELTLLRKTGANVQLLDSGCCGMAGPFGFEDHKFEVSQTIGERVLLPAARKTVDSNRILVTDGFSCKEQITQNTAARPKHLAEVLARRD